MIKTILKLLDGTEISAGKNEVNAIQNTSITESCNDGEDLSFGSVCAKKIEVKIITPQNKLPINAGDKITVYEEENGIRRKKGHFIAEKPQKKGANTTNIVAYDNISLLDKDITEWFNALDGFPYTSYNMAKMVCEHCGIGLANSTITNGDFLINKTELDSVTARQIIRWIGEICGCFCIADENGNAFYRWYEENTIPIVANRLENGVIFLNGGLSYEDYEVKRIDRVEIIQDSNKNVVSYPVWVGEGNVYVIKSNPFMETDSIGALEIAESLYQILEKISYIPCKVSVPASFGFNVGDIVKIKDANGIEFFSYIMEKTRNGQKETLESSGNYERNGATALYNTSYSATYGKNLKIQKDIAKINLEASENSASLELLVETQKDGKKAVRGSVLVEAINDQSSVKILADKVNLTGYVTVNSLKEGGSTVIDGSRIQTGQILSKGFLDEYMLIKTVRSALSAGTYYFNLNSTYYTFAFSSTVEVGDYIRFYPSTNEVKHVDSSGVVIQSVTPSKSEYMIQGTRIDPDLSIYFSENGSKIDLNNGNIITPQFSLIDGKSYFGGDLNSEKGRIGPFAFANIGLYTEYPLESIDNGAAVGVYAGAITFTSDTWFDNDSGYVQVTFGDVFPKPYGDPHKLTMENTRGDKMNITRTSADLIGAWKATPYKNPTKALSEIVTRQDLIDLGLITA